MIVLLVTTSRHADTALCFQHLLASLLTQYIKQNQSDGRLRKRDIQHTSCLTTKMSLSSPNRDCSTLATISYTEMSEHSSEDPAKDVLRAIPVELRLKIYTHLIATGDMAITRASTYTYEECKSLLPTYAVYRVNLGSDDRLEGPAVAPQKLSLIQHIELTINLCDPYAGCGTARVLKCLDLLAIRFLQGDSITRETCYITLTVDWRLRSWDWWDQTSLFHALKDLNGFKLLLLRFEYTQEKSPLANPSEEPLNRIAWRNFQYPLIQQAFRPYLGPSVLVESGEEHGLTFSPSIFERMVESG